MKLDADAVDSNFPIQMIIGLFEMRQNWDRDVQFGQFIGSYRTEPRVLKSAIIPINFLIIEFSTILN